MIVVAFLGCGVVMVCSLILMVEVSWFFLSVVMRVTILKSFTRLHRDTLKKLCFYRKRIMGITL